jgi:hypothetical protein
MRRIIFKGQSKMHNVKTMSNGKMYMSKKEARRGEELRMLEKAGKITHLREQVPYILVETFKYKGETVRGMKYYADFVYTNNKGEEIVEDVKGYRNDMYKAKRKLLLSRYRDINFIET